MNGFFMHRFFSSVPLWDIKNLSRDHPNYHQIVRVFRMKTGEKIIYFTDRWTDIIYEIHSISQKEILLRKISIVSHTDHSPQWDVTIFQSYPNKIGTMEILVQKFTELGVTKVVFFPSEYAQISDIPSTKKTRIASIAIEALEQCGGNNPLIIEYAHQKAEILYSSYPELYHIFAHYHGDSLDKIPDQKIGLWIGPEGGWSKTEQDFFSDKAPIWSFSTRILRLETAAIVGAGILLAK